MEAVGEALLSSAIGLLFDKLTSPDLLDFARKQWLYSDLKKWEKELSDIREELNDAENKQITNPSVEAWLGNLRDLAYDMEDILDEFAYEALQRTLEAKKADHRGRPSKVSKLISTCLATFSPTEVIRFISMRSKVWDITGRLRDISAEKAEFGLEKVGAIINPAWERPITTSLAYEPWVLGRDGDKKIIMDMLVRDEPTEMNFSIVSIVAMGGIGKTTLARLVYEDAKTTNHFDLKAWVCVSDQFDAMRISKTILKRFTSRSSKSQDFDEIQDDLKEALKGKRFLLVLDDMWNENYDHWCCLQSPLLSGSRGSKIIVTTRSKKVAILMEGEKNLHELKHLSDGECWSVFKKHAFRSTNIDKHPKLALIGKGIAKKCGGLPLAAKSLGGLLCCELREHEWNRVLNSTIWDLPSDKCVILPALRLSYNNLSSHLKRCFTYCAIFPKDYEFKKEELILLWMAEGLIQQSKDNMKIEDLGEDYFCELLSRSFFQLSCSNGSRFMMHGLISDLARHVAGKICLHLDDKVENDLQCPISERTRHLSFIGREYDIFTGFERFHQVGHLNTFIALPIDPPKSVHHYISNIVLDELIPKLRYLRVLSLSGFMISEIPNSFGELKHLRYLNLSNIKIKCLPDSISNLYNLQTLILSKCEYLIRLPTSIGNLINLRHLDITGARQLEDMPSQVGKLKDLQTLSNFIVGKNNGLKIKKLKDMSHLRGKLCISKVENVVNVQDAKDACLKSKHNLDELIIEWSCVLDDSGNRVKQMDVLDSLQPHSNLKKLVIVSYSGPEFPHWISDASSSKIVDLSLINCRECRSLPHLGQLPLLKHLSISGMDGVEVVGAEFYGEMYPPNNCFRSLESLCFTYMSKWVDWEDWSSSTESLFPCLRQLTLHRCPRLINKPPAYLPYLTELSIHDCPKLEFSLLRLPSLKKLEVSQCSKRILTSGIDLTLLTELAISNI